MLIKPDRNPASVKKEKTDGGEERQFGGFEDDGVTGSECRDKCPSQHED